MRNGNLIDIKCLTYPKKCNEKMAYNIFNVGKKKGFIYCTEFEMVALRLAQTLPVLVDGGKFSNDLFNARDKAINR